METARLVLTALCFSMLVAPAVQECKEEYRSRRPTHTACRPPNENCTISNRTVTAQDRRLILETHNHYRSTVALGNLSGFPPAADMRELEWDEELASVAQAKAEQCTDPNGDADHDRMADRFTTRFNRTGQNLAWMGRNFPFKFRDWAGRIKSWFAEYVDYPPANVSRYMAGPRTTVYHFTQVVWAKTGYVGCGFIEYGSVLPTNYTNMQFFVCNYAVSGNTRNKPLYRAGKTCSACPKGTTCVVATGLCSRTIPTTPSEKDGGHDVTTRAPGTTVPGTMVPGTTVLGTTVPGTTVPGTTVPGTTVPGTTVPGTTVLGTTVPGTTVPGTTVPGTTVPGTTVPGTTVPGTTKKQHGGPHPEAYGGSEETAGGKNEKNKNGTSEGHRARNSGLYQVIVAMIALLVLFILLFILVTSCRATEVRDKRVPSDSSRSTADFNGSRS